MVVSGSNINFDQDGNYVGMLDANSIVLLEVAKFYRSIVAGGPHRLAHAHPTDSIRIRFLEPDVAFVDVESASMSGMGSRTPCFLVFTKVDGAWGVAVVRSGAEME